MKTSRRRFLRDVAGSSALACWGGLAAADAGEQRARGGSVNGFAYVASSGEDGQAGSIRVFAARGGAWTCKQILPSRGPVSVAIAPSGGVLFAACFGSDDKTLPRGSVEAYAIDAADGSLRFLNRKSLALTAVGPRHITVVPDGSAVSVAVHGGGAYNVLPVTPDGALGPVSARFKETGHGMHPVRQASAHPHTALFDPSGRFFVATDEGCDRISLFELRDGNMERRCAISAPGAPGHAVLDGSGSLLVAAHAGSRSIRSYRVRMGESAALEFLSETTLPERGRGDFDGGVSLAMHPSQSSIYALNVCGDGDVSSWRIDGVTGTLTPIDASGCGRGSLSAPAISRDGRVLFAIDRVGVSIVGVGLDDGGRIAGSAGFCASVPNVTSFALKEC